MRESWLQLDTDRESQQPDTLRQKKRKALLPESKHLYRRVG